MSATPLLEVQGLTRRFGGLVAVKDLDFVVRRGEILGLIGPNGSGKSTVMKMIMGIVRPSSGCIRLDGVEISRLPAHRIARQGVGLVFQHSRPLNRQTVLENIKVALLRDSLSALFADRRVENQARSIAERVGVGHLLERKPATLAFADLRRIELAKAIARHPRLILVDEPFAGLTASEVQELSTLIREIRDDGRAVMLVDHNVKSVSLLADRVLALYLGEKIAEGSAAEVMQNETVRKVYLGGTLTASAARAARSATGAAHGIVVENVGVLYGKAQALRDVSLHVRQGEFVSLVGLNGAGKTTLFNAISGLVPYTGTIRWAGETLKGRSPAAIARGGVVQCPETRELFGDMTVLENLELGGDHLKSEDRVKILVWLFELFPILETRRTQIARTLSGGEQQMLAIARALAMKPRFLVLDEPTLGLAPVILETLSLALERLRRESSITVLLGEQNVTFALPHADRVYVLDHAQITWEGTPAKFAAEGSAHFL